MKDKFPFLTLIGSLCLRGAVRKEPVCQPLSSMIQRYSDSLIANGLKIRGFNKMKKVTWDHTLLSPMAKQI